MTLLLFILWILTMAGLVITLSYRCPSEKTYLQKWADARTEGYYEGRADERRRINEERYQEANSDGE